MKKAPTDQGHGALVGEQLTFLDPPPFCPSWPKRNTLADRACYCRGGRVSCVTCGGWRRLFRDLQVRRAARRSTT